MSKKDVAALFIAAEVARVAAEEAQADVEAGRSGDASDAQQTAALALAVARGAVAADVEAELSKGRPRVDKKDPDAVGAEAAYTARRTRQREVAEDKGKEAQAVLDEREKVAKAAKGH